MVALLGLFACAIGLVLLVIHCRNPDITNKLFHVKTRNLGGEGELYSPGLLDIGTVKHSVFISCSKQHC